MMITARIRRMQEGNSFGLLVCPQRGRGYLPWPSPRYLPTHPGQVRTGGGGGGGGKYPK